jgi:hypothetical protein
VRRRNGVFGEAVSYLSMLVRECRVVRRKEGGERLMMREEVGKGVLVGKG